MSGPALLLKTIGIDRSYYTIGGFRETSLMAQRGRRKPENLIGGWKTNAENSHIIIDATGIFTGVNAEKDFRRCVFEGELRDYQLAYEDGTRINCTMRASLISAGDHINGEDTFSIRLESHGKPTIV